MDATSRRVHRSCCEGSDRFERVGLSEDVVVELVLSYETLFVAERSELHRSRRGGGGSVGLQEGKR